MQLCLVFFGNKIITTGEGGMVVTNDAVIADKCRLLRDHGMTPKHNVMRAVKVLAITKSGIRPMRQAAIGVAQMRKIDSIVYKEKTNCNRLCRAIKKYSWHYLAT